MDVMEPSSRRHTADLAGASKHCGLSKESGLASTEAIGRCNGFVGRQFVVREDKSVFTKPLPVARPVDHALESERDSQAVAQPGFRRLGPGSDVRLQLLGELLQRRRHREAAELGPALGRFSFVSD
jgi:hypothetical protein